MRPLLSLAAMVMALTMMQFLLKIPRNLALFLALSSIFVVQPFVGGRSLVLNIIIALSILSSIYSLTRNRRQFVIASALGSTRSRHRTAGCDLPGTSECRRALASRSLSGLRRPGPLPGVFLVLGLRHRRLGFQATADHGRCAPWFDLCLYFFSGWPSR